MRKGELFQLQKWKRQGGLSAWGIQTGPFADYKAILKPLSTPLSKKEGRKMPMISFPSPGRSLLANRAEKILTGPVVAGRVNIFFARLSNTGPVKIFFARLSNTGPVKIRRERPGEGKDIIGIFLPSFLLKGVLKGLRMDVGVMGKRRLFPPGQTDKKGSQ